MRARIHGGANEIGGNCIELEARGKRLLLDLGRPLWAKSGDEVSLPPVTGLRHGDDPRLLGVVISHPHPDHYGLLDAVPESVPVFLGRAACQILKESAFFSPCGLELRPDGYLEHRMPLQIGPFTVTPHLMDHSAFDAYGLLVEGSGRRLFYTGDFRAHGRKSRLFDELIDDPPADIDTLILEGTHIRVDSDGSSRRLTERDVENACVQTFRRTQGMVLAMFSPQNIDRLVSMYRACLRTGRDLVMDLYTAAVARATGRDTIPQADWNRVRVYLPNSQRSKILRTREFHRTHAVRKARIYRDQLANRRNELVMTFRASMARELEHTGCLAGASAVWSTWPGYLEQSTGVTLDEWLRGHSIGLDIHHASGHAYPFDLKRLTAALAPRKLVPIHSLAPLQYPRHFPGVNVSHDAGSCWWEV